MVPVLGMGGWKSRRSWLGLWPECERMMEEQREEEGEGFYNFPNVWNQIEAGPGSVSTTNRLNDKGHKSDRDTLGRKYCQCHVFSDFLEHHSCNIIKVMQSPRNDNQVDSHHFPSSSSKLSPGRVHIGIVVTNKAEWWSPAQAKCHRQGSSWWTITFTAIANAIMVVVNLFSVIRMMAALILIQGWSDMISWGLNGFIISFEIF